MHVLIQAAARKCSLARLGELVRHRGQLILEPFGGQSGGELAGHVVSSLASGGVDYAVTLHAWAPEIRLTSGQTSRVIQAPEPGFSLPQVIATLKAILG
jgi:hypothetical protein